MPDQRIKGQEVTILFNRGGELEDTLTDIQDFEFEPKLEIIQQGYLGEKSDRYDEIFNGGKFTATLHIHDQAYLAFQQGIINRAKRLTPDVVFNTTAVMLLPNGQTPTVLFPDCFWGPQPQTFRSRKDYLGVKLEGHSGDVDITLS
jgi:hypothetical protein